MRTDYLSDPVSIYCAFPNDDMLQTKRRGGKRERSREYVRRRLNVCSRSLSFRPGVPQASQEPHFEARARQGLAEALKKV